jgi:hypothetical protein
MATEIYPPPQLSDGTKIYRPPTDVSGSTIYEDPNKVVFVGNIHLASTKPIVVKS